MRRHYALFAAVCVFAVAGPSAHAARLLKFTVEQGGKPVLVGIASDSGRATVAEMWNYLHRVRFEPSDGANIDVQSDDPSRGIIRGPLSLRIEHASFSHGEIHINDLILIRDDPTKNVWRLPEDEIVRATHAAGAPYTPPGQANRSDSLMWIAIVVVAGVIVTVVGVWLWRKADAPDDKAT
jgi:hypothetical protein